MEETRFTPGPWLRDTDGALPIRIFVEDSRWKDSVKTILSSVGGDVVIGTGEYREDHANAHLIAAAPDLYEALYAYVKPDGCFCDENSITGCRYCVALAALAKARGKE